MTISGKLWQGVLPGVLRELYVGRKTGVLSFSRADERRNVHLRGGHIVNADTSVREDRLGEMMVRHGQLTAADLKRARGFSLRDNKKLGVVLVELGLIDERGLEEALQVHLRAVLSAVFSWPEGEYQFTEQPQPEDEAGEATLHTSTGDLILEAARAVEDPDVVRYNLGDIDRVLAPASDPLLRFQRIALTPTDGFLLSRIDGTLSAREVMQLIPLPPPEVQRSLFGLLSTGVVEYLGHVPPRPAPPPPAARKAAPPKADEERAAPEPPAPPAPLAPEPPPAPSAVEVRRTEIQEAYDKMRARSHYEILGIARDAGQPQVKEAYFRMARQFHPDVHHDPALHDLRDKLEAVFIRLGEAYETLRSAQTRADYDRQLGAPGSAAPPPGDPSTVVRQAEDAIRLATRRLAEEKYWDAIQLLEAAIPRVEGAIKQAGRVLLARAYAKNPKWMRQSEQLLQQVIQEDPENAEAHFHLAGVYRAGGLRSRAAGLLRRTLELRPDHEQARAQLEALEAEAGPPPPDPGLLGKLLRKK